jgi:uncharacterized protein YcgI (DUF1989 family)
MIRSCSIVIPPHSGQTTPVIRIIDPKGQQVADLWAFVLDEPKLDWLCRIAWSL